MGSSDDPGYLGREVDEFQKELSRRYKIPTVLPILKHITTRNQGARKYHQRRTKTQTTAKRNRVTVYDPLNTTFDIEFK